MCIYFSIGFYLAAICDSLLILCTIALTALNVWYEGALMHRVSFQVPKLKELARDGMKVAFDRKAKKAQNNVADGLKDMPEFPSPEMVFDNPNDSSLLTAHAINFEHVQSTRRMSLTPTRPSPRGCHRNQHERQGQEAFVFLRGDLVRLVIDAAHP